MKLFACDYDGTLYRRRMVEDDDIQMIKEFRDAGNLFGIVTGRTINSIVFEIHKHRIPVDFIVGINGGVVLDEKFQEIYKSELNQDVMPDLMAYLESSKVEYYGANDGYRMGRVAVEKKDDETEFNVELTPISELMEEGLRAFYVRVSSHEDAYRIAREVNAAFEKDGIKAYPNNACVDIGSIRVSKASGIQKFIDAKGLSLESIYAVGDAYNDLSMLEKYHGFIMSDSASSLREMGFEAVNSVKEALIKVIEESK